MTCKMSGSSKQGQSLNSATQLIDTHCKHSQHLRNLEGGLISKRREFNNFKSALDKCDFYFIFSVELCQQIQMNSLM